MKGGAVLLSFVTAACFSAVSAQPSASAEEFADIFVLVDNSLPARQLNQFRNELNRMIGQLDVGPSSYCIGLALYGRDVRVEFRLNTHKNIKQYEKAVKNLKQRPPLDSDSDLAKALEYAAANFFTAGNGGRANQGARQFLVVALQQDSDKPVFESANKLRSEGVTIVAMSETVPKERMRRFADQGFEFENLKITELKNIFTTQEEENIQRDSTRFSSADIVFVICESDGIGSSNFHFIRTFVKSIIGSLIVHQKKDRVAIITYSDRPTVHAHLNSCQDRTEALESINRLRFQGGGTRTGAALRLALDSVFTLDKGSRKGVQKFAIVITDGESQDSVREAAVALQRAAVQVFAIGPKVNSAELYDLASYPSIRHVFEIDGFTKLKALTKVIQKSLFHSILQSSTNSFKNSQDVIEACAQKDEAGIFFLIDDSDSVTERDLADTKNFIAGFIKTFRIKLNNIRIGLVKYSNSQTLEFYLSKKSSDSDVNKLLEKVTHQGGGRRTGGALESIDSRFQLITPEVPTYLILVTAGQSEDDVREPARKLGEQGVTVFAVGLKNSNKAELQEISGDSERSFYIRDYYLLKQIKDNILRPICGSAVCEDSPSDVIFLTESSNRISAEDFRKMKEFMKSVINKSIVGPDGVHVGVMQFSTNPELVFSLKSSKDEILRSIDGMNQLYGGVQTGQALSEVSRYFAASQGGRPIVMQNLVLITFSEAVDEIRGPAKALREKGVVIFSIDAQDGSYSQLTEISGPPDRVVNEVKVDLIQELDSMLALKFCDPQRDCKKVERADIIFLVDGSESIADRFGSMQIFMESIVNQTIVSEDSTRFGAILYSSTPEVQFRLNQYASSTEVRQAIYSMVTPNASTYTGLALEYSLQFFEEMNGGRRNLRVPQILMVITDGVAYDKEKLKVNSDALRANGVSVMSIGVKGAEMDQLLTIAGNDESLVFYVDTFDKLETLYTNMTEVICNQTKNDCDELDLVFLLDRSGSINTTQHKIMKDFTGDLVENLQIGEKTVHVGLAQFSENFQDEFYLNKYYDKQDIANHIRQVRYLGGSTYLGKALNSVKNYFSPSRGSRDTVPKTLVVFTDGNSYDDVEDVSNEIRNRKIADDVIAIAIGDYYDTELLQITGDPRKIIKVGNIENLPSFKKKVSGAICNDEPPPPTPSPTPTPIPLVQNCTIDVAIGFDISQAPNVPLLRIVSPLQEIVRSISIINDLSNLPPLETKISFSIMSPDGSYLYDTNFEAFNPEVLRKTSTFSWSQATYFNSALLSGFNAKFQSESRASVKVLIIFSDGLDEDVMRLKQESERLKTSGVSALLVVALDSAQAFQLLMVEFGRAHNYKAPLKIGLQSISSVILQELSAIADRICCNVFCKCYGPPGPPGLPGTPGDKGAPGEKGHPGYPGEEGSPGRRGPPGLPGLQGIQGCPGHRGQKGSHSFSGSKGEDGENGLDGINGEQGETGEDGMKGQKGDTGGAGIPGTRGEKGLKGQRGLRGDPGETGRNNNRPGTKGEPGNQGEPGTSGSEGDPGEKGEKGMEGREGGRGLPGVQGGPGEKGEPGLPGVSGVSGTKGPKGNTGPRGPKGIEGFPGIQGNGGQPGVPGTAGRTGAHGEKGQPGDPGDKGSKGHPGSGGPPGQEGPDGVGEQGPPGSKGSSGFPGYPGPMGEKGDKGGSGFPGRTGNPGRSGNSGRPGEEGEDGDSGYSGHKGGRGPPGKREKSECELITYIRDNCACCHGQTQCPAYPTELVFGLDMSDGVTLADFDEQRRIMLSMLRNITIAESNCPTGARVSVVAYSRYTKHLIRFQEHRSRKHLIEAIENLAKERTLEQRHLGAAMLYVGRNVFKHVRAGQLIRKVAVFFTSGESQQPDEIVAAVMEYRALNIISAVISARNNLEISRALEIDDSGNSIFSLRREGDLEKVKNCAICYDPCIRSTECSFIQNTLPPKQVDVDLAIVVDSSRNMQADEYAGAKQLLGSVVEQLVVSPQPRRPGNQARIAVVQQSGTKEARVEFDLQTYQGQAGMKQHLMEKMQQQSVSSVLGQTLDYTLKEVLLKGALPRRRRALLAVVTSRTENRDRDWLRYISLKSKCEGVAMFVVAVGDRYNQTQVREMAGLPTRQHLVRISRLETQEQGYVQRFFRVFLSVLSKNLNPYPPASIKTECNQLTEPEDFFFGEDFASGQELLADEAQTGQSIPRPQQEEIPNVLRGGSNSASGSQLRDVCFQHKKSGSCKNFSFMWFYNSKNAQCTRFLYSGCGGNQNRFKTREECEDTCLRKT